MELFESLVPATQRTAEMTNTRDAEVRAGPCGRFRFEAVPRLTIGLVHLDRKRPWPSAVNPETGREWREDMKARMLELLASSGHTLVRSDEVVTVSDDPSLRSALGNTDGGSRRRRRYLEVTVTRPDSVQTKNWCRSVLKSVDS